MKLINVSCYNCDSTKYTLYDKENGFNLVKCTNCGLLFVNPRPDEGAISEAAKTGMHAGKQAFDKTISYFENKIPRYLKILDDLYKPVELANKTWLDIGCGHGEFMIALQKFSQNKIELQGLEPNLQKVKSAKSRGLVVSSNDTAACQEQFDSISVLDVFSHLPNPLDTLLEWKKLIKDGGEILIETGHSSHLPKKFHNKPYDLPDHLSFANKEILLNILSKVGFEILETKMYRGVFYRDFTLMNFSKEMVKFLIGRRNSFHSFFKPFQHGDMYIRAKKIN